MTIKELKNILRYYDEDADVKIIVNTDDVHYCYGFYRENTEAICECDEDYKPDEHDGCLVLRADITDSKKYEQKGDADLWL